MEMSDCVDRQLVRVGDPVGKYVLLKEESEVGYPS